MPRRSAAVAAETAHNIVDVAAKHFARDGYSSASVDAIAREAGVTRGAVYHHYDSKLGLFGVVVDRMHAQVADAVMAAAAVGASPADSLRLGSHAFLDAITAEARVLLIDAPAALGWSTWRKSDAAASGRLLHEALAALGLRAGFRDAMAAQLSGAMNEAALWLAETDTPAARRNAHRALDQLLDAVI